jgi:uncharacterized CHY-type Zn-finger protein
MAIPMRRNEKLEKIMTDLNPSGRAPTESIQHDICTMCGKPALDFKDVLSRKEYTISGMCQKCQDDFFNQYDNDDDE